MATTADYLTQLQADKQTLVDNLVAKGVEATSNETFTTLAPKVANISGGGANFEITDASYLFYYKARIDIINELCSIISSSCTNFKYMFAYCDNLTEVPELNTSNGTDFYGMFMSCNKLTEVPQLDTSNGTNFYGMFHTCANLTTIPELNTSNGTNFDSIFSGCSKLTTIPELDGSNATNMGSNIFNNCKSLTTFGGFKNLGKAYTRTSNNYGSYKLDLSKASLLTHESLMNVINNLYDLNLTYDVANGGTLYTQSLVLGSTLMALLTEEEIAVATAKGWVVS